MVKGHVLKVINEMQCYKLPGAHLQNPTRIMVHYYGAPAANIKPPPQTMVHVADRVMNQEAMVTAFLVEKSMAFSMVEPIIDMEWELSKDPQALAKLHLFRTMASSKMVYGTSKTVNNNLVKSLQTTLIALNMDEATAPSNSRMCTVLVTYSKDNNIITEHLNSFTICVVSSETLFEGMKSSFERLNE